MSANSRQAPVSAALPIEERIRQLRADVEFAAQSFHCWERYVHHWSKPKSVNALNYAGAEIWFQVSEWSSRQASLMALGRLYDRSKGTNAFGKIGPKVLADASAEDGATWDSLCADDDVRIEKLRIIRDGELAHRLLVMGRRGDTVRLNVDELEQLVESAKRRLKFLEKLVGLPVVPFFKREAVFKSVDSVFQSLIERVGRRADEWARLPEHYLFVRKLRAHESVKQLIVFGSFARGEQRQGSDIDLAITCVPNTPSQRAQIEAIVEDADTLRRIDLVWLDSLPEASSLHAAIKRDGRALKGEVPT